MAEPLVASPPVSQPASAPLLEVRDLHAWYGRSHILHGVGFDVHAGEVVTLLGRNGAGKTTTLKSIMGMVGKRTGSIVFGGQQTIGLASNRIARLGIAICPEERGIFASLNVEENLLLPPLVRQGGCRTATSSSCFRTCVSASPAEARISPAASSRCWRSAAFCARERNCCCSMNRPRSRADHRPTHRQHPSDPEGAGVHHSPGGAELPLRLDRRRPVLRG